MNYQVEVLEGPAAVLRRMDPPVRSRIIRRIKWISIHLDEIPLHMLAGKFRGMYRNKLGDYRIIFSIDKQNGIVFVHKVGHRSEIYD